MKILFKIITFFLIIPLKASPMVNATWLSQNLCKEDIKLIEVGSSYNSFGDPICSTLPSFKIAILSLKAIASS